MLNLNSDIFPEAVIPEEDMKKTPGSVLKFLDSLLKNHRILREQLAELAEANALLNKKVDELESRLSKNSSNSDKPPSSDSPFEKRGPKSEERKKQKKKPGGRPGHKGHKQKLLKPTEEYISEPEKCSCGGSDFKNLETCHVHQEIELPEIDMLIRHFIVMKGECTDCGRVVKGSVPQGHQTGYGPRLSALIGEIGGTEGNSRETVQTFCSSVLGIHISLGAIQNVTDRVSEAIEPHWEKIGEAARDADVNYIDETSWKLSGTLNWLWVMANSMAAFFMVHTNRSKEAFMELVSGWAGILVSDGYAVYRKWVGLRQTCLAHLIRKAKGLEERKDRELSKFGTWAKNELQRLCHMAKVKPTQGEWLAFYARLSHLTARYRDCSGEAGAFARRLEREMEHMFLFLKAEGVEPTNNFAERMLRFAVLWRRRSQGTRSEKGNRWAERILSLRQTCRIRGKPTFEVPVDAVESSFNNQEPDLSWIDQE